MDVLRDGERLIIFDPPLIPAALSVLFVCIILIGLSFFLRHLKPEMRWWAPLVMVFPVSTFGVWLAGTSTKVTLDHEQCVVSETQAFFERKPRTIPLADIHEALIARGRKTAGLVLKMNSGEEFAIGILSDRPGTQAAVEAINQRLAEMRSRSN